MTTASFAFAAPKGKPKKSEHPPAKQEAESTSKAVEKVSEKARESNSGKYTEKQIELSLLQLPSNYFGNDPSKVHSVLNKRINSLVKGEFETTQQYQKRIEDEKNLSLAGEIGKNSLLAFQVILKGYDGDGINYFADDSEFDISLTLDELSKPLISTEKYNKNAITVKLQSNEIMTEHYVASNAYGVTVNVENNVYHNFHAAISNHEDLPIKFQKFFDHKGKYGLRNVYVLNTKLKSSPEEAKNIKNNIRFLLIGNIVEPYTSSAFVHSKPTRDNPRELTLTEYFIYLSIKEIWIYNQATGQIYNKIKKKGENPAVNANGRV